MITLREIARGLIGFILAVWMLLGTIVLGALTGAAILAVAAAPFFLISLLCS